MRPAMIALLALAAAAALVWLFLEDNDDLMLVSCDGEEPRGWRARDGWGL